MFPVCKPTYFLSLGSLTLIYCFTLFKKGLYVIKRTPSQMTENTTSKLIKYWSESTDFDANTRAEIQSLIKKKKERELNDRFYKELDFGTGGIRGIIAAGTNRINFYTVRKISIGFAKYIQTLKTENSSIAIAYDNRKYSKNFAQEAATTFASFGIKIWIFEELTSTPMLSFAVRFLKANGGVVITASHNPSQYNGYKIYNSDGAQICAPEDLEIKKFIDGEKNYASYKLENFDVLLEKRKIQWMPQKVNNAYFQLLEKICIGDKTKNPLLNLVYSPLYGTGKIPVSRIMQNRNFQKFHLCENQSNPDSNFGGLKKPNPEEEEVLIKISKEAKPEDELLLATDPDADRIGVMVKEKNSWRCINGNQIGQLLLYYYLRKLKEKNKLPKKGVVISTIVTSPLQKKIAESFGMKVYETLTGFKNIANVMKKLNLSSNTEKFVFGCEESHGYLFSDEIRDKDGIMAAVFFAEMATELKAENKTPLDLLEEIYQKYGYWKDNLKSYTLEGIQGQKKIALIMASFQKNSSANFHFSRTINYEKSTIISKDTQGKMHQEKKEELFFLKNGSRITALGTEIESFLLK